MEDWRERQQRDKLATASQRLTKLEHEIAYLWEDLERSRWERDMVLIGLDLIGAKVGSEVLSELPDRLVAVLAVRGQPPERREQARQLALRVIARIEGLGSPGDEPEKT